jgi:hypothetical protein
VFPKKKVFKKHQCCGYAVPLGQLRHLQFTGVKKNTSVVGQLFPLASTGVSKIKGVQKAIVLWVCCSPWPTQVLPKSKVFKNTSDVGLIRNQRGVTVATFTTCTDQKVSS